MDEKKKANRWEISRDCQEEFVNSIAETMIELAKEDQKWVQPWTSETPMGFPFNASTGHEYSGANMVRLMLISIVKKYDDDRWMTFKQLQHYKDEHPDQEMYIRKGEKGTRILRAEQLNFIVDEKTGEWTFPGKKELQKIQADKEAGKPVPEVQSKILFYPHTVFNASQIQGFPPKEEIRHNMTDIERNDFLEKFVASSGVLVTHHGGNAYYKEDGDEIKLPYKERFISTEEYYATKMHEYYHATGHKNRENRLTSSKQTKEYAFEEMRAELFSMLSGSHLHLPMPINNSAAYINHWNKTFSGGEAKAVFKAATDAAKILTVMQEFERGEQPKTKWFPDKTAWPELIKAQKKIDQETANPEILVKDTKAITSHASEDKELSTSAFLQSEPERQIQILLRNKELLSAALKNDPELSQSLRETCQSVAQTITEQKEEPTTRMKAG